MNYLLRRIITVIVSVFLISLITFFIFELVPGDPIQSRLGIDADDAQVAALRKEYGLDLPPTIRYLNWTKNALKGDLGTSLRFDQPVNDLIRDRLSVTFTLSGIAFLLTLLIGLPLGMIVGKRDGRFSGLMISLFTQLGMAIPGFWLGIIFTYLFGLILKLFVPGRYTPLNQNFTEGITYLFFAAAAMSVPKIAVIVRYLRNSILEQVRMDYVRTAKSKGLRGTNILYNHVLRNALIPVITILGMITADFLGGSLILEQVFNIPGIGRLLLMAITNRDFPLVQGIVLYIALIVVLINFLVDLLYRVVDPRIQLK